MEEIVWQNFTFVNEVCIEPQTLIHVKLHRRIDWDYEMCYKELKKKILIIKLVLEDKT